jgi:hypothetical protein
MVANVVKTHYITLSLRPRNSACRILRNIWLNCVNDKDRMERFPYLGVLVSISKDYLIKSNDGLLWAGIRTLIRYIQLLRIKVLMENSP